MTTPRTSRKKPRTNRKLVDGDRIMLLQPKLRRAPVRVDRTMPSTYEEYVEQREEREWEAARAKLLAARDGFGSSTSIELASPKNRPDALGDGASGAQEVLDDAG